MPPLVHHRPGVRSRAVRAFYRGRIRFLECILRASHGIIEGVDSPRLPPSPAFLRPSPLRLCVCVCAWFDRKDVVLWRYAAFIWGCMCVSI